MKSISQNIVSFDIFDTLLLRPYLNPQELWNVLEEQEKIKGFAKARKKADALTYKKSSERGVETSIEEAYSLMPKKYACLMQKEMNLERKILRANPEMLDLWNELGKAGKIRIIVSDMYLPKEFIESVLQENGITGWNKLYLSREYNCRKATGALFELIIRDLNIQPGEILHIGDNENSDVEIPQALGINVRLYKKVTDRFLEECPFAWHIDQRLAGTLAVGWHQFKCENPNYTYWNRLGFLMGGVLGYLYVSWIVETSKKLGKDRLLFVARDGYILRKICNLLYPEMKTEYIYAPRLTSIAVLGAIGSDPIALADRKQYMETHLKGVDTNDIKKDYSNYIAQYNIDDKCALVDGCSSGFSAQRLVEACVGRGVFCFYLVAMAEVRLGAALYQTNGYIMEFQRISEFLFSSSEFPIKGVVNGVPEYMDNCSKEELFKIHVSNEISKGALDFSSLLKEYSDIITPDTWIDYADWFMTCLSKEDFDNLSLAKNALDVEQRKFEPILWKPRPKQEIHLVRKGRYSFELLIYTKSGISRYYMSWRTFIKEKINLSFKTKTISLS